MMLINVAIDRLVKEKGDLFVANLVRQMYQKCGMCVLVVVAFIDPDEQLNISLQVILQLIFCWTLLTYIQLTTTTSLMECQSLTTTGVDGRKRITRLNRGSMPQNL